MSTTRREVPVTSIYAKAVFTGNVSGDVTTITSVTFTQNEDDWLLGVKKEDMPSVMDSEFLLYIKYHRSTRNMGKKSNTEHWNKADDQKTILQNCIRSESDTRRNRNDLFILRSGIICTIRI